MTKAIIIAVCLFIYLWSAWVNWHYVQRQYSKGGEWCNLNPTGVDLFFVYTPVLNTVAAVDVSMKYANLSNHFKIKK